MVATVITALQAETGGTDYLYARRIGSILRESATIVGFVQDGDWFQRKTSILDIADTNPGTAAVTRTLSVPTGIRVQAWFNGGSKQTSAAARPDTYFSDLSVTDSAPSATAAPLMGSGGSVVDAAGGTQYSYTAQLVFTNTSAQIRSRSIGTDGSSTIYVATLGWIDSRGRYN